MLQLSTYVGAKLFVLDTNVILHDAGCLRNFEENDVAIPITVLEELDTDGTLFPEEDPSGEGTGFNDKIRSLQDRM